MVAEQQTLATALRVELPNIIVHGSWRLGIQALVEGLTIEEWSFTLRVERPVHRYSCHWVSAHIIHETIACLILNVSAEVSQFTTRCAYEVRGLRHPNCGRLVSDSIVIECNYLTPL